MARCSLPAIPLAGLRVAALSGALASALLMSGLSAKALTIDNFSEGAVDIVADGAPPNFAEYVEVSETGLTASNTIGGSRLTWVQDGVDFDPATAELIGGVMRMEIDNDENQSGLSYRGLGGIALPSSMGRIAIDILYSVGPPRIFGGVELTVTLLDTVGGSGQIRAFLADAGHMNVSGTYELPFDAALHAAVDLSSIERIDLSFRGDADYDNPFEIDNIRAIPEPGVALLLALALVAVPHRREP